MSKSRDFDEQLESVREVTRDLIESIRRDEWPRGAAILDFGIDSQTHYEALYYPIREGEIEPSELDEALGHGEKLSKLTREAPSNPHKEVEFHTAWDDLYGRRRALDRSKEKAPLSLEAREREEQVRENEPDRDRE
jgi:hypothetical protein